MKKHKVLKELLPLVIALFLVGIVMISPLSVTPKYSQKQLDEFAVNPQFHSKFIGIDVKEQALAHQNFLPIMGSSELEHFDPFFPSSFFTKYKTGYTPYLIGMPGTQSLSQFFYVNSANETMKNRKIVFIISPQWFVPRGVEPAELEEFVSNGQIYDWLKTANPNDYATQALARRLLSIRGFITDVTLKDSIKTLSDGKKLSAPQIAQIDLADQLWKKEDSLFTSLSLPFNDLSTNYNKIQSLSQQLPSTLDFNKLYKLAKMNGELNSANNKFNIQNSVWSADISKVAASRKDVMKNVSYQQSPEYADFQQLLDEFAANHDDVEFVIPPVNGAWYSYSGLSYETLENFSEKITYQLKSQGFTNILDLTDKYNDKYYIGDTIHLGNCGWVAVDQGIMSFMKKPMVTNYNIKNNFFLSDDWQQTTSVSDLQATRTKE